MSSPVLSDKCLDTTGNRPGRCQPVGSYWYVGHPSESQTGTYGDRLAPGINGRRQKRLRTIRKPDSTRLKSWHAAAASIVTGDLDADRREKVQSMLGQSLGRDSKTDEIGGRLAVVQDSR